MQFLSASISNKLIADNIGGHQFPDDASGTLWGSSLLFQGQLGSMPCSASQHAAATVSLEAKEIFLWTVQEGQCSTSILTNMKSQYFLLN